MENFVYVDAPYNKIYDIYVDEHEIVTIDEKQPQVGQIGILVAGDSNSQFMTFEMNRYYDNIDLSTKMVKVFYIFETEDGKIKPTKKNPIYADNACNICYNEDTLRFSWLLPAEVALNSGKVAANISIIGLDETDGYSLNTTMFELEIHSSLTGNDTTEASAKLSWISDIEARIYKLEQHSGLVDLDYNTLINKPKINGIELDGDVEFTFVEKATQTEFGGIKVLPKEDDQTQPVGIDEEGFLWVKPSSGGGGGTGADGFSPIVSMSEEEGGTLLTIVDKNGIKTAHIKNGINGTDGADGTNGKDGVDGINGVDGFTPVPKIETITEGTRITITKKDGDPEEAIIPNGKDGEPGKDGASVTAAVDDTIEGQHTVTLTDKDGDKSFTVKDGTKGSDGSSVTVVTEVIEGGNKVTFTDKDGDKSFEVLNGTKGDKGDEGSSVIVAINETVEKEHKVTFTDKDGDKEIIIKDGVDGKDGKALIDDTAESGSDISWSVDKIIAYVQKVLEDIENGTY